MRLLLGSELCQDCVDDEGGGGPDIDPSHGAACWRQSRGFVDAPFCPVCSASAQEHGWTATPSPLCGKL